MSQNWQARAESAEAELEKHGYRRSADGKLWVPPVNVIAGKWARMFFAAEAMLLRLQWSGEKVRLFYGENSTLVPTCLVCHELQVDGHAPDCELAKLLKGDRQ